MGQLSEKMKEHGDSFTKALAAMIQDAKLDNRPHVLDAEEIPLDDKALIRLMHLIAQEQKSKIPDNLQIKGLDKRCAELHKSLENSGHRIIMTSAYLDEDFKLKGANDKLMTENQKIDAIDSQLAILAEKAKKYEEREATYMEVDTFMKNDDDTYMEVDTFMKNDDDTYMEVGTFMKNDPKPPQSVTHQGPDYLDIGGASRKRRLSESERKTEDTPSDTPSSKKPRSLLK